MRLPSGREIEVVEPTYGQALELRKRAQTESNASFQAAAIEAVAPKATARKLTRTDLLALAREATRLVGIRTADEEIAFREQLAAGLGGFRVGDPEALSTLMAYRWCAALSWSYQEVAETPMDALPLCLLFKWSRQQLLATPARVVNDFLTIFNYKSESASDGN